MITEHHAHHHLRFAETQRKLFLKGSGELQAAHDANELPDLPGEETRRALNDLLVRVRLAGKRWP